MKIVAKLDDGQELELAGAVGKLSSDSVLILQIGNQERTASRADIEAIRDELYRTLFNNPAAPDVPVPVVFLPHWVTVSAVTLPKDLDTILMLTIPDTMSLEDAVEKSFGFLPETVGHIGIKRGVETKWLQRLPSDVPVSSANEDALGPPPQIDTRPTPVTPDGGEARPPESM